MNLIFLGPPGSGKGTQSSKISLKYNLEILATGDILRSEIDKGSSLGMSAENYIKSGDLVPDKVVIEIIQNRVKNLDGFLLDGFPRNLTQAKELKSMLLNINKKIDLVINFEVPDSILIKRILGRFICKKCKEVYNDFYKKTLVKGRCDKCNSSDFKRRSDDNEETLKNRMSIFHESNDMLCEFYRKNNLLISISGVENQDFIFQSLEREIDALVN